jgi:3-oxoacyl-[acyl-carrier protein] reductase
MMQDQTSAGWIHDFTGKVVLVTGGGQGIGRGIVEHFAGAGAQVVIADLNAGNAAAVAQGLQKEGRHVTAHPVDLAERDQIRILMETVEQTFGRLDALVHNAGYFPLTPFADITPEVLERTLAVNLSSLFWLTQQSLPLFRLQGKGCVLVTSSVTGPRVAYPGLCHYAAAKAGVNGFIRNAALELAPHNVRVNGVEPGMMQTPAMGNLGDSDLTRQIRAGIPLGRLGQPSDIAGAMLFLASEAASFITGQTLVVDGGMTLPESKMALA